MRKLDAILITGGMLACLAFGYAIGDGTINLHVGSGTFDLSSRFRKNATPAYIALTRMRINELNVTGKDYQSARLDAEAALAVASPTANTASDREAYFALRQLLETTWDTDAREEMIRQEMAQPTPYLTFDQNRVASCWVVVNAYLTRLRGTRTRPSLNRTGVSVRWSGVTT